MGTCVGVISYDFEFDKVHCSAGRLVKKVT